MTYIMQIAGTETVTQLVSETVAFLPLLVGALLILIIGWFLGSALGRVISKIVDRVELDKAVVKTPIGGVLGGTEQAVSGAFGTVTKWFVFAIAILAAADVLNIALLSEYISTAVAYLPAFVAGLAVILIGFVVADFVGDAIKHTKAATEVEYTGVFATGVRLFLYFTVVVIGLSTMGVDVTILNTFAQAFAWGLAAAVAIGAGIAIGWGGHDYVSANIDRWMGSARDSGLGSGSSSDDSTGSDTDTDMPGEAAADGGVDSA